MTYNYGVIIVCRNEENLIASAIESVLNQTIKPTAFLVIDDGSTDRTREVIRKYPDVTLIETNNPRYSVRGVNIALSTSIGIGLMYRVNPEFEILLTMDADCRIPSDYIQKLGFQLLRQRKLGIASGISNEKLRLSKEHITNGARLYKRKAVDIFYPFRIDTGFDSWLLFKVRAYGFRVQEYKIKYTDLRPYNRKYLTRWYLSGRARYLHGFPLIWVLYQCPRYSTLEPFLLGYLVMLFSYLAHHLTGWAEPSRTRQWVNLNLTRAYVRVFRKFIRKGLGSGFRYILRVMSR